MTTPTRKEGKVDFGELTDKNLKLLRLLNSVVFPVTYPDSFYTRLLTAPEYTQLAYFSDILAGAVSCRLEHKENSKELCMYIMTLGVLEPYRKLGIGNKLLKFVFDLVEKKNSLKTAQNLSISEIFLHVQVSNDVAINFYKKNGFTVTGTKKNYYHNIEPSDCYILTRPVTKESKEQQQQ
eukprot:TRINITY_DN1743_c0_g1_i1.p1 TRINITY_DN1743_c0_g1~~TRINITY_DN1743_c0_g1_i1.p1  ORF type:complete len:180 (-),score=25.92 TRINITY_DN1743_c0_g1_i1:45-584(-)